MSGKALVLLGTVISLSLTHTRTVRSDGGLLAPLRTLRTLSSHGLHLTYSVASRAGGFQSSRPGCGDVGGAIRFAGRVPHDTAGRTRAGRRSTGDYGGSDEQTAQSGAVRAAVSRGVASGGHCQRRLGPDPHCVSGGGLRRDAPLAGHGALDRLAAGAYCVVRVPRNCCQTEAATVPQTVVGSSGESHLAGFC